MNPRAWQALYVQEAVAREIARRMDEWTRRHLRGLEAPPEKTDPKL